MWEIKNKISILNNCQYGARGNAKVATLWHNHKGNYDGLCPQSLKMELSLNSDYNNNLVVANAITIPFYTSPEISLAMIAPIV